MGRPKKDKLKQPDPMAVSMRGTAEWNEWLTEFAKLLKTDRTKVIDLALNDLARKHRFEPPPPRISEEN